MRILRTFSRDEYILEDEEGEKLEAMLQKGVTGFIKLRCGDMINVSSIEAIRSIPLRPFYRTEDGDWVEVMRDGESIVNWAGKRIKIDRSKVEYLEDPKYQKMLDQKLLK